MSKESVLCNISDSVRKSHGNENHKRKGNRVAAAWIKIKQGFKKLHFRSKKI